jgi:hypothetical protein
MKMKGYRTLILNLLLAIAPVLQSTGAADLGLTGNAAAAYAVVVTFLNVYMRTITTTPVCTK